MKVGFEDCFCLRDGERVAGSRRGNSGRPGPCFVLGASALDDEVHVQIKRAALDKQLDLTPGCKNGPEAGKDLFEIVTSFFFLHWGLVRLCPLLAIRVSTREREREGVGRVEHDGSGSQHHLCSAPQGRDPTLRYIEAEQ